MGEVVDSKIAVKHEEYGYYRTIKGLCKETGRSPSHIRSLLDGIKEQVRKGRYSRYSLLDGGEIMVNVFVFYDYLKYRKMLGDKVQSKHAPKFDPKELAEICPVCERILLVRE